MTKTFKIFTFLFLSNSFICCNNTKTEKVVVIPDQGEKSEILKDSIVQSPENKIVQNTQNDSNFNNTSSNISNINKTKSSEDNLAIDLSIQTQIYYHENDVLYRESRKDEWSLLKPNQIFKKDFFFKIENLNSWVIFNIDGQEIICNEIQKEIRISEFIKKKKISKNPDQTEENLLSSLFSGNEQGFNPGSHLCP